MALAGNAPVALAAGDLNGDGHLNVVTANEASDDVSVLLGLGNGFFSDPVNLLAGDRPLHMEIVDLDGDLALDILVANELSDDLSLFLGNGDGTFAAELVLVSGNQTQVVVTGDFNTDGLVDYVVGAAFESLAPPAHLAEPAQGHGPHGRAFRMEDGTLRGGLGSTQLSAPISRVRVAAAY